MQRGCHCVSFADFGPQNWCQNLGTLHPKEAPDYSKNGYCEHFGHFRSYRTLQMDPTATTTSRTYLHCTPTFAPSSTFLIFLVSHFPVFRSSLFLQIYHQI